jgi:hypothetical protein
MMMISIDIEKKNEWLPKCQANNWILIGLQWVYLVRCTCNKDFAKKYHVSTRRMGLLHLLRVSTLTLSYLSPSTNKNRERNIFTAIAFTLLPLTKLLIIILATLPNYCWWVWRDHFNYWLQESLCRWAEITFFAQS